MLHDLTPAQQAAVEAGEARLLDLVPQLGDLAFEPCDLLSQVLDLEAEVRAVARHDGRRLFDELLELGDLGLRVSHALGELASLGLDARLERLDPFTLCVGPGGELVPLRTRRPEEASAQDAARYRESRGDGGAR